VSRLLVLLRRTSHVPSLRTTVLSSFHLRLPADVSLRLGDDARLPADATLRLGDDARLPVDATLRFGDDARLPADATLRLGDDARLPVDATLWLGGPVARRTCLLLDQLSMLLFGTVSRGK
jgi:hypothetical protein